MSENTIKKKTLVVREGKYREFLVYEETYGEWATCGTPHLYPVTATMEALKKFYPSSDFNGVRMVEVEIKIIEE